MVRTYIQTQYGITNYLMIYFEQVSECIRRLSSGASAGCVNVKCHTRLFEVSQCRKNYLDSTIKISSPFISFSKVKYDYSRLL